VTQCNLVAVQPVGQMKKMFSSLPRRRGSRIFPVIGAVGLFPDLRPLNVIGEVSLFKIMLLTPPPVPTKSRLMWTGDQVVVDLNSFAALIKQGEQGQAVLPRKLYENAIPFLDHLETPDRFPRQTPNLIFLSEP